MRTIISLGIGTLLHYDALLANVAKNPEYVTARYKGVISFATHTELWEAWERIYTDLENPAHQQDAEAFFKANEDEMLEGTAVLWEEKLPYRKLPKSSKIRAVSIKSCQAQGIKNAFHRGIYFCLSIAGDPIAVYLVVAYGIAVLPALIPGVTLHGVNPAILHPLYDPHMIWTAVLSIVPVPVEEYKHTGIPGTGSMLLSAHRLRSLNRWLPREQLENFGMIPLSR